MQAVNKHKRKPNVETRENLVEEIADVEILLEQLKLMINAKAGVVVWKRSKLERLQQRLDDNNPL